VGELWDDLPRYATKEIETRLPPSSLPHVLRMLELASEPSDLIVDPFCRSGVSLIAAELAGRSWIAASSDVTKARASIDRTSRSPLVQTHSTPVAVDTEQFESQFPRVVHTYIDVLTGLEPPGLVPPVLFIANKPVPIHETRHYEFKECRSSDAVKTIPATTEAYVAGFLNCEGGRIYWGVRNTDRAVVGVTLSSQQRDNISRVLSEKFAEFEPSIDPHYYKIHFHSVHQEHDPAPTPDLYVLEVVVPAVETTETYYTSRGECFIKTDGGLPQLKGKNLVDFANRRAARQRASHGPQ